MNGRGPEHRLRLLFASAGTSTGRLVFSASPPGKGYSMFGFQLEVLESLVEGYTNESAVKSQNSKAARRDAVSPNVLREVKTSRSAGAKPVLSR